MPIVGRYFVTNLFSQYLLIKHDFPVCSSPTNTIRSLRGLVAGKFLCTFCFDEVGVGEVTDFLSTFGLLILFVVWGSVADIF